MSAGPSSYPGESVADRLIREAMEAGEFDELKGSGEPIPGRGSVDDELWWHREWVRRNSDDKVADPTQQEEPPAPTEEAPPAT